MKITVSPAYTLELSSIEALVVIAALDAHSRSGGPGSGKSLAEAMALELRARVDAEEL